MAFIYKLLQNLKYSDQPAFEKELTDTFKKVCFTVSKIEKQKNVIRDDIPRSGLLDSSVKLLECRFKAIFQVDSHDEYIKRYMQGYFLIGQFFLNPMFYGMHMGFSKF